jgi:hypothetical protein
MAVKQKIQFDLLNEKEMPTPHYSDYGRVICNYISAADASNPKEEANWMVARGSGHVRRGSATLMPHNKVGGIADIATELNNISYPAAGFYKASFLQFILDSRAQLIEAPLTVGVGDVVWVDHQANNLKTRIVVDRLSDTAYLPEKTSSPLEELILKSNALKSLTIDWDEDGALPIDETTVDYTSWFLRHYYNYTLKHLGTKIQLPEINPCPDGSIDLEWHTPHAQLLINIRKDKEGTYTAYYYGDRHNNKMQVKGSTPLSEFSEHLAVWMKYLA